MTGEEGWSGLARVAVQSVGCKLNQAETEWLAHSFHRAGYRIVASDESADVYILNTCTVTHVADRKCRNLLRQARRRNPRSIIVATGCYAERAPNDLATLDCAPLAVGNAEKDGLVHMLGGEPHGRSTCSATIPVRGHRSRSRAMVKVHEGCSQRCSFCIVPSVRGDERSRPARDVIADVKARVSEGCCEVVLTGTRIGRFHGGCDLGGLVERILAETKVSRLRLSSLEPDDLTGGLLRLWENPRVCPHIHMPLQSGSDAVLERMGRPYSADEYLRAAARARDAIPSLTLTTDVMVGFPGETDLEFADTFRFCESVGFADLHVFPYSARPGTSAALMADNICDQEKRRRTRRMLDLARRSSRSFRQRFLGQVMRVLWEEQKEEAWLGRTDNYLRVHLPDGNPAPNHLTPARITALYDGGLRAELVAPSSNS